MAKRLEYHYTFSPSTNQVIINGNVTRSKLLLITNVTDNIPIYSFADTNLRAASVSYDSDTELTTINLNYNCSSMSSGDKLQIFTEDDAVAIKPSEPFTDPVSKFRVSQAQTLIDTDFEYGLQSTKWETLELVNNVPGFYSKTGDTPLTVTAINVTSGSRTVIITAPAHGQNKGTPIDVRGLNQPTLEGSYVITRIPDVDTIIIDGKVEANTTGTINGPYTSIIPGRFYAGSQLQYGNIVGLGTTVTVTMQYPSGFKPNSEFYLVNTVGTETITFDSTLIDPIDTVGIAYTINPLQTYNEGQTNVLAVDPWDYTGFFRSVFIPCDSTHVDSATNTFTSSGHTFSNGDVVVVIQGPDTTLPAGLNDRRRHYVVNSNTSTGTFQLSLTAGGAAVTITTSGASTIPGGIGVFAVCKAFTYSAINSSTDRVTVVYQSATAVRPDTILEGGSDGTSAPTTSTPLIALNYNTTIMGTATPGLSTGRSSDMWSGVAPQFIYFRDVTSTQCRLTSTAGGTVAYNFTANTVPNAPILLPVQDNTTKNTINVTNHGLSFGDPYNNNVALAYTYRPVGPNTSGEAISGLSSGTTYYIDYVDANTFGLSLTSSPITRVNLTGYAGLGTAHTFEATGVSSTKDTIYIPSHGLTAGQQVSYNNPGDPGDIVGGLVDDQTYYILDAVTNQDDRFRLSDTLNGSPVNLTSAGVGTHQLLLSSVGDLDGSYVVNSILDAKATSFTLQVSGSSTIAPTVNLFDSEASVGTVGAGDSANSITIANHTFITGTPVTYSNNGGTDVTNIVDGTEYYVIRTSKDRIGLATHLSAALSGIAITFGAVGVGTEHRLTSYSLAGESIGIGSIVINSGSTRVIGTDTQFLSQFKNGDPFPIHIGINTTFEGEVASVGSNTQLTLVTAPSYSGIGLTYLLKTGLYVKSEAYGLHRPYDGGVEINARKVADNQIIRQTRRYFRYQSGKGLSAQFAINFNPPIDVESITAVGQTATLKTRYRHEIEEGSDITIRGATVGVGSNYYNGTFTVDSVESETSLKYTMNGAPADLSANGFPEMIVRNWGGSYMRAGMYDDQNGLFWEYDGSTLYAVRRNSVSQISGSLSVTNKSNLITGSSTRFTEQLSTGDRIVIRGQTYKVVNIDSTSTLHIQPAYRGITNSGVIASKVIDDKVAQANFSIDPCDGSGPNGYVLDLTRIQMVYIDYSWYGAGKARFGFKDARGEVFYAHEFIHNNKKNEAYFRSGNLPARYEIENVGSPAFAPSLAHWGSTVQMDGRFEDDQAYLFTASSSLLSFSGESVTVGGATTTATTYTYVNANGTTSSTITTFDSRTFTTVNTGFDFIEFAADHGYATGQLVQYDTTSAVIGGLTDGGYYYARVLTTRRIAFFNTEQDAIDNTNRIDLTSGGSGTQSIRTNFRFAVAATLITGYGNRIIHRVRTTDGGWTTLQNITFGTPITSTVIGNRGGATSPAAYVYRVSRVTSVSDAAFVDFFFAEEPSSTTYPSYPSLADNGFIPTSTSSNIDHTFGDNTPPPALIPLISIRLAPSVDSGLTGAVGIREIMNRMQLDLKGVGLLTTHDVDIRLILNAQLDNTSWVTQGKPSLSQVVPHQNTDAISSGINIFSFRASGGAEVSSGGVRSSNTFSQDISDLLSLGNAILGGDGTFPDGPDVLTLAVVPLNPSQITLASPFSVSGRITWSESQA